MTPALLRGLGLVVGDGIGVDEDVVDEVEELLDGVELVDDDVTGATEKVGFDIEELGKVETTTKVLERP